MVIENCTFFMYEHSFYGMKGLFTRTRIVFLEAKIGGLSQIFIIKKFKLVV